MQTAKWYSSERNLLWPGRGFVREADAKQGRLLGVEGSATKGRPLGATIHVSGINKTVSASSTFGDFYRCLQPPLIVCQPCSYTAVPHHLSKTSPSDAWHVDQHFLVTGLLMHFWQKCKRHAGHQAIRYGGDFLRCFSLPVDTLQESLSIQTGALLCAQACWLRGHTI